MLLSLKMDLSNSMVTGRLLFFEEIIITFSYHWLRVNSVLGTIGKIFINVISFIPHLT